MDSPDLCSTVIGLVVKLAQSVRTLYFLFLPLVFFFFLILNFRSASVSYPFRVMLHLSEVESRSRMPQMEPYLKADSGSTLLDVGNTFNGRMAGKLTALSMRKAK
jgi:hypothetical protein